MMLSVDTHRQEKRDKSSPSCAASDFYGSYEPTWQIVEVPVIVCERSRINCWKGIF